MSTAVLLKNPLLSRAITESEEKELQEETISPYSLLLLSCRTNSLLLAETALTRGAPVNQRDKESWTPLMHASYHNSWKVIPLLIRHRAIPHLRDDQGDSPMDIARYSEGKDSLEELDRSLSKSRLKQAGLFLQPLTHLIEEKKKPSERQNKTAMALCYIDLGYGWWLSEERIDKTFHYFHKASTLDPRVGSFPYASLLASCGYPEEALHMLFRIAKRRWGVISRKDLSRDEAFYCLFQHPQWEELLRIWPQR